MANGSVRRANSELTTVELVAGTVPVLGSLVDNLVESREDVVSELHLSNRGSSRGRGTNCKSSDTLFGERSVEDSISAVFLVQAHGAAEDSTELDIFAEDKSAVVCFHCDVERLHNR